MVLTGLDFQEYFALCQESMLVSSDVRHFIRSFTLSGIATLMACAPSCVHRDITGELPLSSEGVDRPRADHGPEAGRAGAVHDPTQSRRDQGTSSEERRSAGVAVMLLS